MPSNRQRGPIHERSLEHFVQSDPEDSDFEDVAPRSARKSKPVRSKTKPKAVHRRQATRHRARRSYDSSDIVDDSESLVEDEGFTDESGDNEPAINPTTGRPTRRATRNSKQYAESDSGEEEDQTSEEGSENEDLIQDDIAQDSEDELAAPSPQKTPQKLLITLKVNPRSLQQFSEPSRPMRNTRARSASRRAPSEARTTRRSARISQEPEDGFLELTNSGHARPVASKAPSRTGGKAPVKTVATKQPSIIQEESQDDAVPVEPEDGEQQAQHGAPVESIEDELAVETVDAGDANDPSGGEDSDAGPIRRTRAFAQRKVGHT
jgi:hypothetical protein